MIRYPKDLEKKKRILESICNLEHLEAFKVFLGWLDSEAERICMDMGSITEEINLRWAQGQFQILNNLQMKIVSARDVLDKLRDQTPPKGSA